MHRLGTGLLSHAYHMPSTVHVKGARARAQSQEQQTAGDAGADATAGATGGKRQQAVDTRALLTLQEIAWLAMVGYGWLWLAMLGYAWLCLAMLGYGWL